jgi:hypothetical protein
MDFWERRFSGEFGQFAKDTKMPGTTDSEKLENYEKHVKDAIDKACEFHLSVSFDEGEDWVHYLYSAGKKMGSCYSVIDRGGSLEITESERKSKGDGRVLVESATNKGFRRLDRSQVVELDNGHGELLSDLKFLNFVDIQIKPIVDQNKAFDIAAFAQKDPVLRDKFITARVLVSPSPGGTSNSAMAEEEKRAVALLNSAVAAQGASPLTPKEMNGLARKLEFEGYQKDEAAARVLYESVAQVSEKEMDARTLNRLGYILLKNGDYGQASVVLGKAKETADVGDDPHLNEKLKGFINVNLGAALSKAGDLK